MFHLYLLIYIGTSKSSGEVTLDLSAQTLDHRNEMRKFKIFFYYSFKGN